MKALSRIVIGTVAGVFSRSADLLMIWGEASANARTKCDADHQTKIMSGLCPAILMQVLESNWSKCAH
jgi:hypothetical protein